MHSASRSFSAVSVRHPRVELPELPAARPRRVWWAVVCIGLVSLGALVPVVFSPRPEVKLVFALLGIAVCSLGLWIALSVRESLRGRMRIRAGAPLRFASANFGGPWGFLSAVAMIAAGAVHIAAIVSPNLAPIVTVGRRAGNPVWIIFIGLGMLAYLLHRGVPAAGIEIDERGVRTRTGLRAVVFNWDELGAAQLVRRQNGLILGLVGADGSCTTVFPFYFGSDPVIIAEVIEHYRTHPEERHLLSDPIAALGRVVEM